MSGCGFKQIYVLNYFLTLLCLFWLSDNLMTVTRLLQDSQNDELCLRAK